MSVEQHEDFPFLGNESHEELQRIVEALYRVHRLVAVITDLDSLLARLSEQSRRVARAEASSVMLYDEATKELYFEVALGDSGDQETLKREIRLRLGEGIAGQTAATRQSMSVEDVKEDPHFFQGADDASNFETRNLLAVPMLDRDRLIGVLEVVNKIGGGGFSTLDMRVMEMFASLAASSISNARLIEEQIRTERLAAIGQAVTGLSHYTKNIVSGLNTSADLIDIGLDAGNTEVLQRSWAVFKRSTKRISNFVQDMLSFSKPRKPLLERCTLPGLIDEAVETFGQIFVQKSVDLTVDTTGAGDPFWADSQAIYRCLLNLLLNAADAAPDQNGEIHVRAGCAGEEVFIEVMDNGPGVPEELHTQIFDPFFSTKGSKGTGLGLAVTRKIVDEHGGRIHLLESPEGGALFRMELPLHRPAEKEFLSI